MWHVAAPRSRTPDSRWNPQPHTGAPRTAPPAPTTRGNYYCCYCCHRYYCCCYYCWRLTTPSWRVGVLPGDSAGPVGHDVVPPLLQLPQGRSGDSSYLREIVGEGELVCLSCAEDDRQYVYDKNNVRNMNKPGHNAGCTMKIKLTSQNNPLYTIEFQQLVKLVGFVANIILMKYAQISKKIITFSG